MLIYIQQPEAPIGKQAYIHITLRRCARRSSSACVNAPTRQWTGCCLTHRGAALLYHTTPSSLQHHKTSPLKRLSAAQVRAPLEQRVREFTDPPMDRLLPDLAPELRGRVKTLVLDLEGVLVHKEWSRAAGWKIHKRPGAQVRPALFSWRFGNCLYIARWLVCSILRA